MNSADMAGALRAAHTDFASESQPSEAGGFRRTAGVAWGALCGTAFLAARASVYLVALAIGALACIAGVVLYPLQAAIARVNAQ